MRIADPLPEDTQALVDALERVRERPGTVELFDALVAGEPEAVALALAQFPRHPRAEAVAVWLTARGIAAPRKRTAEEVLAHHGILDVEDHLLATQKQLAILQRGLDEAWTRAARAETVANAYAAILVLLVALAALGWAGALGVVPLFANAPEPVRPAKAPAPVSEPEAPPR